VLFASPYDHLYIPSILLSFHQLSLTLNLPFNIPFYHPLFEVPNAPLLPFTCAPFVPSFTPYLLLSFLYPASFEHLSPLSSSFPPPSILPYLDTLPFSPLLSSLFLFTKECYRQDTCSACVCCTAGLHHNRNEFIPSENHGSRQEAVC
jgi:hypothetical protein